MIRYNEKSYFSQSECPLHKVGIFGMKQRIFRKYLQPL